MTVKFSSVAEQKYNKYWTVCLGQMILRRKWHTVIL